MVAGPTECSLAIIGNRVGSMGVKPSKAAHRSCYLGAESLSTQTKRLLHRFDLRARKGLGQHFLIDEEVLRLVTSAAELAPADIVMEIGPGVRELPEIGLGGKI